MIQTRFFGTFYELIDAVAAIVGGGTWRNVEADEPEKRFDGNDGSVIRWWPYTHQLVFQGEQEVDIVAARLREAQSRL